MISLFISDRGIVVLLGMWQQRIAKWIITRYTHSGHGEISYENCYVDYHMRIVMQISQSINILFIKLMNLFSNL